jgi:hypothetical protein
MMRYAVSAIWCAMPSNHFTTYLQAARDTLIDLNDPTKGSIQIRVG